MHQRAAGFTLIELVVVLVLLGIISMYAAPKFTGRGGYSEMTARQDIKQSIRYAQQLAMSQTDRAITFVTSVSSIDVRNNGASVGNGYPKTIPTDVTLNSAALTFNRLGATSAATITATGTVQALNVCVNGTTGYAYDC